MLKYKIIDITNFLYTDGYDIDEIVNEYLPNTYENVCIFSSKYDIMSVK